MRVSKDIGIKLCRVHPIDESVDFPAEHELDHLVSSRVNAFQFPSVVDVPCKEDVFVSDAVDLSHAGDLGADIVLGLYIGDFVLDLGHEDLDKDVGCDPDDLPSYYSVHQTSVRSPGIADDEFVEQGQEVAKDQVNTPQQDDPLDRRFSSLLKHPQDHPQGSLKSNESQQHSAQNPMDIQFPVLRVGHIEAVGDEVVEDEEIGEDDDQPASHRVGVESQFIVPKCPGDHAEAKQQGPSDRAAVLVDMQMVAHYR